MTTLSSPLAHIKPHYTVVVIGSGYGGGIAASRLARSGQQVCVLERGKELQPGEYPDTLPKAMLEMQTDLPDKHLGSETGLFDLRVNDSINVLVGCGLGGTSLINASVSLQAEPRVFEDPCWPEQIRAEAAGGTQSLLQEGFRRAELMLNPVVYPDTEPRLDKMDAHRQSAAAMGEQYYRTPINVTFEDGTNHAGIEQKACVHCGDCVSGCNYGSKNTTLMNYLPDAFNHGAEIYTEVSVSRVVKGENGWLVYYQPSGLGREAFKGPDLFVRADIVVLAAGTLGTTEILLRSRDGGLSLSRRLGEDFTGNGDVLAFAYNNDLSINGVGFGDKKPDERQ
ncbi:MAG TPA: GMC family oxidoreductase, partial [Desulfobulbaceae bacterium]|nr:GMC family oxidoreductase [Desulfobulbaceae bacterium]